MNQYRKLTDHLWQGSRNGGKALRLSTMPPPDAIIRVDDNVRLNEPELLSSFLYSYFLYAETWSRLGCGCHTASSRQISKSPLRPMSSTGTSTTPSRTYSKRSADASFFSSSTYSKLTDSSSPHASKENSQASINSSSSSDNNGCGSSPGNPTPNFSCLAFF